MSEFDVRKGVAAEITSIRFSNDEVMGVILASTINRDTDYDRVEIRDSDYFREGDAGYLVIANKSHAENLILALNKAISLGWLK